MSCVEGSPNAFREFLADFRDSKITPDGRTDDPSYSYRHTWKHLKTNMPSEHASELVAALIEATVTADGVTAADADVEIDGLVEGSVIDGIWRISVTMGCC